MGWVGLGGDFGSIVNTGWIPCHQAQLGKAPLYLSQLYFGDTDIHSSKKENAVEILTDIWSMSIVRLAGWEMEWKDDDAYVL